MLVSSFLALEKENLFIWSLHAFFDASSDGSFWCLQCSPDYAYGAGGFPAWGIQPNSVLDFEIEFLSVQWALGWLSVTVKIICTLNNLPALKIYGYYRVKCMNITKLPEHLIYVWRSYSVVIGDFNFLIII